METLIALAVSAGLPMIEKLLSQKIGDAGGQLASDVIRAIAGRAGITPDEVEVVAEQTPGRVIEAMREVERAAPDMIAAYDRDVQLQLATLAAEQDEPLWARMWRPGGMYLIGFLWLWNAVILHVANAIFKIALPPMPWDILMGLSSLYFALYMGGHTVKDLVGKWVAK